MARLYCPRCKLDDQTRAVCSICGQANVLMGARVPEFKNNPHAHGTTQSKLDGVKFAAPVVTPSPRVQAVAADIQMFMNDMAECIPNLKCTIRERELIKAGIRTVMAHAVLLHLRRQPKPQTTLCPKMGAAQWTCGPEECRCHLRPSDMDAGIPTG